MSNNEPSFSLNDFRKWLSGAKKFDLKLERRSDSATPSDALVECRLGIARLEMQIEKHNPNARNASAIAKDFKEHGAKVVQDNGDNVMLETANFKFEFPKMYIRNG